MATDLIQRAAAICGLDNPNSDQLAAWLGDRTLLRVMFNGRRWWANGNHVPEGRSASKGVKFYCPLADSHLDALAAAVVEVDRIEWEAAK